jgi:hypothetical protein
VTMDTMNYASGAKTIKIPANLYYIPANLYYGVSDIFNMRGIE